MIEKRNISIIPYYEKCPHNCWFCIWKGHPLENTSGPSIEAIDKFLNKYSKHGYRKFSISGSDAIYEKLNKYKEWWNTIFNFCKKYKILFDIHTKSRIYNVTFLKINYLNKLVLSTEMIEDCKNYIIWLKENNFKFKIRIVKVITSQTTKHEVEDYIDFTKKHNLQLTFKQLHGYNDGGKYCRFKRIYDNLYKHVVFLNDGDYNIYLMPDNLEYTKFDIF